MSKRRSSHEHSVGKPFGRLTVDRIIYRGHMPFAECTCKCGNPATVQVYKLYDGHTQSCGCLQAERTATRSTKHGGCGTATYRVWRSMISRCYEPVNTSYKYYGGRGIKVCARWRSSFAAFLKDMGERPAGKEIDRIDNNGNYEPRNCRWATRKQQNRNTRHNHNVTHNGKTQPVSAWAEELGVSRKVIYGRLRRGQPITG